MRAPCFRQPPNLKERTHATNRPRRRPQDATRTTNAFAPGSQSTIDCRPRIRASTRDRGKASPSQELISKLLRVLKPDERDAAMVRWLVDHVDADPELVGFALLDPSISADVFAAAAGIRHRGSARPDPATLIARVKRAFDDEDE